MNKVVALFGGKRAADAFRKTVSGDPTGAPAWAQQMAIGNDVAFSDQKVRSGKYTDQYLHWWAAFARY